MRDIRSTVLFVLLGAISSYAASSPTARRDAALKAINACLQRNEAASRECRKINADVQTQQQPNERQGWVGGLWNDKPPIFSGHPPRRRYSQVGRPTFTFDGTLRICTPSAKRRYGRPPPRMQQSTDSLPCRHFQVLA